MCQCIRAVVKFLNCTVYFPDDNFETYPGILYPGDMTVYRYTVISPGYKIPGYFSDKLKSVKLNYRQDIRLYKPHVVSAVISCHLPGYLTGCQIPRYLMENTRVFVSTPVMWHHKTGVLKNTGVFFVKYPGIFQYPGNMTLHRDKALSCMLSSL